MSWCRNAEGFLIFVIVDLKVKGFISGGLFLKSPEKR